jgi:hypothetical protein
MAAGGTVSNVKLGPGRLYLAPLATAEPTNCSTALPSAWIPIGYTEEGTAFTVEVTQEPIMVAEEIDPILYVTTMRKSSLALSMAEVTRNRLAVALGQTISATSDSTLLEPGAPGSEVAVMGVWDRMDTPDATNSRWLFRQMKASGPIQIQRRKAPQKALLPVTFNLEVPAGKQPFAVWGSSTGIV